MIENQDQNAFINVKIKTLNHSIYDIIASPLKNIRAVQAQIQQKTKVPIDSQRLLYRGIVLDPQKTLADYRIQQGNIIQLVANKLPSQHSQTSSIRRSQINRTHNYSQQHSKTKKYRQLQQRLNGFRLKKQQSLQVLQQNKHTIDQLMECLNINFIKDVCPFKLQKRNFQVGEWLDVKDASGQWIQGQIINKCGDYVQISYNGFHKRWNQWISISSQRIMPFRTHTVQMIGKTPYLSPYPSFERSISAKNNSNFKTNIQTLVGQLTLTLDNLSNLLKDLQLTRKDDESLQNVSNIDVPQVLINQMAENQHQYDQEEQIQTKQEFQTPSKENPMVADNSSNICQDDRSSKGGVNDDVSSKKSYKSKRSQGLVDTASMKSLTIDQSRRRQNKVYLDHTEQAQSVCSVHHKSKHRYFNTSNQQYILQEVQSYNEQQFEQANLIHKKEMKAKMRASQLAPILDRMGRFLIDIAPHFALIGHTDQLSSGTYNQNLSTFTNEGSLLSKMSQINKFHSGNHQINNNNSQAIRSNEMIDQNKSQQKTLNNFCSFQVPVMLTPHELVKLQKLIQSEKRNLHML